MSYVIVKKNSNRALNGFDPHNIPTTKYGKFSSRNMFLFYNDCCTTFDTTDEAEQYITYIKRSILENKSRYERCYIGSSDKLMKIANNLKVIDTSKSNFADGIEMKPFWKW